VRPPERRPPHCHVRPPEHRLPHCHVQPPERRPPHCHVRPLELPLQHRRSRPGSPRAVRLLQPLHCRRRDLLVLLLARTFHRCSPSTVSIHGAAHLLHHRRPAPAHSPCPRELCRCPPSSTSIAWLPVRSSATGSPRSSPRPLCLRFRRPSVAPSPIRISGRLWRKNMLLS